MAFKPFEFFRKRQKIMLAGVTIMAMFLFVIGDAISMRQGGGSVFAARIKGWLGVVDNAIAEVNSQGIDSKKIYELYQRRQAAIEFVYFIQREGRDRVLRDAGFSPEDRQDEKRFQKKSEEVRKSNPDALKPIDNQPMTLSYQATVGAMMELQNRVYRALMMGQQPNMASEDPLSVEGLLEFQFWLDKADELRIVVSPERVKADLLKTGYSSLREEDLATVVANLVKARHKSYDTDSLIKWVGDEIRVMIAKAVVQNPDRFTGSLLAAAVTPLDLWEAYVKVKTQLTVGMLPLKVTDKQFADQVAIPAKGSAGWQEFVDTKLKPFFEQYKDKEPDPARDTPGFRVPKKYQVEFVYASLRIEATGKTDAHKHYEEIAAAENAVLPVVQALGTLGLPLPTAEIDRALSLYELNKLRGRYRLHEDPASAFLGGIKLADGSRYQLPFTVGPGPINSAAGVESQTAAQQVLDVTAAITQSPVAAFGISGALRPMPRRVSRTLPQPLGAELAAAVGGHGLGLALGFAAQVDLKGEHQSFPEVAANIYDETLEDQCRYAVERDLQALSRDLAGYGKFYRTEYDKWKRARANAEARGLPLPTFVVPPYIRKEDGKDVKEPIKDNVTRWSKSRGFVYEGMKEPRGLHELLDETGATPLTSILRQVYVEASSALAAKPDEDMKNALIGKERFGETTKSLYEATDISAPNPRNNPGAKPKLFALHWKIAETDPRAPTFAEMEDKVLEAWKAKEARALIEEYAEKLAPQVKSDDGYRILLDKEGYQPEKLLGRYESVGPFNYRKMNVTYMDHPPDDVIDLALTKLKNKYDTLLVANKPKSIYYFLILKERKEPSTTDGVSVGMFDNEVIIPDSTRQLRVDNQPLTQWVVNERSREFLADWEKYFRDRTKYNETLAKQAQEMLKSSRN